jgi:hypothetical protein
MKLLGQVYFINDWLLYYGLTAGIVARLAACLMAWLVENSIMSVSKNFLR